MAEQTGAVSQNQPAEAKSPQMSGWLTFWMILFGTHSASFAMLFFTMLAVVVGLGDAFHSLPGAMAAVIIELMIFSVLIFVAYLLATLFIAMKKKIARILSLVSIGLTGLATAVVCFTAMGTQYCYTAYSYYGYDSSQVCTGMPASAVILLVGVIFSTLIYTGLASMYFIVNEKAKQALVR